MKQFFTLISMLLVVTVSMKALAGPNSDQDGTGVEIRIETKAYPNPFKDQLTIEVRSEQAGMVSYTLTDLLGNTLVIQKQTVPAGKHVHSMDTSELSPGYYFMAIEIGEERIVKRVLKN